MDDEEYEDQTAYAQVIPALDGALMGTRQCCPAHPPVALYNVEAACHIISDSMGISFELAQVYLEEEIKPGCAHPYGPEFQYPYPVAGEPLH